MEASFGTAFGYLLPLGSDILKPVLTATLIAINIGVAQAAPPPPNQLPTGGQVATGQAAIGQSGAVMTINQSSPRAIIDWQTFNVGEQAQVNFLQPSSISATLNRVLDANPSQIYGRITAPGQVFFTNPNGILFAPSASVDVGGLLATTHHISNDDFMAGSIRLNRQGATGRISNSGNLSAGLNGYVAMLAPEVQNSGVIVARLGTVALAAGEAYELQFDGNRITNIRVEPAKIAALVENKNAVIAPEGLIILSAQAANQLQGGVVKNTGSLEATGLVSDGGAIRLLASDRIEHSGSIKVDAAPSKVGSGGTALLIADLSNSNSQTVVSGSFSARGGDLGGDGGFIETSASRLDISNSTRIDTLAPLGKTGQWLLDPVDITIAASGGNVTGAAIATALQTSNVTLDTAGSGTCTSVTCTFSGTAGDIFINDDIAVTGGSADTTLTFKANRNITQDTGKVISNTSRKLNVIYWADSDASGGGQILLRNGSSITTNGGHMWMGGGSVATTWNGLTVGDGAAISTAGTGVEIDRASLNSGSGDISITGTGGGGLGGKIGVLILGGIVISNDGNITINGRGSTAGTLANNEGVKVDLAARVEVISGSGTLRLDGVGGNGTAFNIGVNVRSGSTVRMGANATGLMQVIGVGGNCSDTGCWGVLVEDDGAYKSLGAASIEMIGTGGSGNDNKGIKHSRGNSNFIGDLSMTGNITLRTDSLDLIGGGGKVMIQSKGGLIIEPKTSNATIGLAGGTGTLSIPAANFTTNFASGFSNITVGSANAGAVVLGGALTSSDSLTIKSGGNITLNAALSAPGKTIALQSGGTVSAGSSGYVSASNLLLTGGNVTLTNLNNAIDTLAASGVGSLNYTDKDALTIGTVGATSGVSATGAVSIGTLTGNLTVAQTIQTTDTSASALMLNAGINAAAGTTSGGDIVISGSPTISTGNGGRAVLYTGSLSGSTGLSALVGNGSGRFRYNADETTNFALGDWTNLGSIGTFGVYREQPILSGVTVNNQTVTYGSIPTWTFTSSGLQNGDTLDQAFSAGPSVTVVSTQSSSGNFIVGTHTVNASGTLGASRLGYATTVSNASGYTAGTLTVNPRPLTVTYIAQNKVFDGTLTANVAGSSAGIIAGDIVTFAQDAAFADSNAGSNKAVNVSNISLLGTDASNYAVQSTTASTTAAILPAPPALPTLAFQAFSSLPAASPPLAIEAASPVTSTAASPIETTSIATTSTAPSQQATETASPATDAEADSNKSGDVAESLPTAPKAPAAAAKESVKAASRSSNEYSNRPFASTQERLQFEAALTNAAAADLLLRSTQLPPGGDPLADSLSQTPSARNASALNRGKRKNTVEVEQQLDSVNLINMFLFVIRK